MARLSIWQGFQYANVTLYSEYARIYLDRALNTSRVLNMPGIAIWQGSKYTTIWLDMSELDVNMPAYVSIYDNRQVSENVRVVNMSHAIHISS